MGRQGQPTQHIGGLMDGNERLLVADRHALPEVLHIEVGAHFTQQFPPSAQLVGTQCLVLARGLDDGKSEVEIGVLELVVLLAGWTGPAGIEGSAVGAMQPSGKAHGQGEAAATGGTGEQHGVCQGPRVRLFRKPGCKHILSYGFMHRFHNPKIQGVRSRGATAHCTGNPGREH